MVHERAATAQRVRGLSLDVEAVGAALPLLVVLAVGTWRKGGFFRPDIVVLPLLALALLSTLASSARSTAELPAWVRANAAPIIAVVSATAWWLGSAIAWHHGVDSWRMPASWLCAVAGYLVARGLPARARTAALAGVVLLAFAVAAAGLALVAMRSGSWTWLDERSLRLSGPLTYPSATGLYLAVALLASIALETPDGGRRRVLAGVRVVLLLGIVATDSRGAVVGLAAALCFRTVRRELGPAVFAAALGAPVLLVAQRDGVRPALVVAAVAIGLAVSAIPDAVLRRGLRLLGLPAAMAVGWLLLTQHHAVDGLDASWTERGNILSGALDVFRAHPAWGAGADPTIPAHTLSGAAGIAYFAHDEPLEVILSVGLVGAIALAVCALFALRPVWRAGGAVTLPVVAATAAAGLVDFVWHFPALGLLVGLLVGAAGSATAATDKNST